MKANNKYMKNYDKNREPSYLKYWNVNKLYGWAVSPKLNEKFMKTLQKYITKIAI